MATVIEVIEMDDGSSEVRLDFSPEEMKQLMTYAVTNMIRKGIKLNEKGELDESCYD